ncbi:MAG: alpha/beta hydrolase [Bacteroidales bacterium]|nr:alpha/beta hydrolase [Bacteroidales bacterium]
MATIKIDDQELAYGDKGDSERVIVLMHGWGCSSQTLLSIEKVALDAGYRVINVDFPGFGLSPEPSSVWGVEEYTALMEKFIDRLGIKRPVMLGHSFGGRVGILFSSRREVSKLILVDAAGVKPRRSLKYHIKVKWFKFCKAVVKALMSKEAAERTIEKMRSGRGSADYAAASPMMRMILSKVVNEDLCHVMPSIKAPVLLVWGTADTATPLADAIKMEKLIPDAGLVRFEGCGHYSFLDNPSGFARVLTSFLNS